MNGILLVAHGNFASGLYSSLKLISGELENVKTIDFLETDTNESLDKKLILTLNNLNHYDNIIILTDIAGGTPFNKVVLLTEDIKNTKVFSGTNFQMLYTAAFDSSENIEELAENILSSGKNGITSF